MIAVGAKPKLGIRININSFELNANYDIAGVWAYLYIKFD